MENGWCKWGKVPWQKPRLQMHPFCSRQQQKKKKQKKTKLNYWWFCAENDCSHVPFNTCAIHPHSSSNCIRLFMFLVKQNWWRWFNRSSHLKCFRYEFGKYSFTNAEKNRQLLKRKWKKNNHRQQKQKNGVKQRMNTQHVKE